MWIEPMYKTVIAIDLETTGIDPARDEILEIGAAVLEEGRVTDRFQELVAVRTPPPAPIVKLTGIAPEMLQGARPLEAVLPEFLRFLEREDAAYIAHNAAFDRAFLQAASADLFRHRMLDTVGLARIFFPRLQSHALGFLAEALGLAGGDAHRAAADCEATLALWRRILAEAYRMPRALLGEMNDLLARLKTHPFREFFLRLDRQRFAAEFGKEREPFLSLFRDHKEILSARTPERELDRTHGALDGEEVAALFAPGGALARTLPGFEKREGQREMARNMAQALSEDRHLLVEAPTGIGKTLAYLVPVALFSTREGYPVILSTNTKNLQAQLFEKDIPLVRKALGIEFKAALIKGRGNYLCLRKLLYLLDNADRELVREERIPLATLLSWAVATETGDIAECVLTGRPDFSVLWAKLRTIGDECLGRACRCRTRCFLRRARSLALQADLVVANHALVFAEMNMESAVLPEYRQIVFDEAHNLEAVATEHLTVEVSLPRVGQVLGRLFRRPRRGQKGGTGLAASLLASLGGKGAGAPEDLVARCGKECEALLSAIEEASRRVGPFFEALARVLPARTERVRFAEGRRKGNGWTPLDAAKRGLVASLAQVMRRAESAAQSLREMPAGGIAYLRDYERELEAVLQWLREVISDVEFVLAGSESNYVYWVESASTRQGGAAAYAAPLSIAELMHDQVYARKMCCVFSSATLTVRGKFEFLAGRLGIDRVPGEKLLALRAESPFDYDRQCLVAVPAFLAEPDQGGSEEYVEGLSALLAQVFRRSRGRALALFTSYDMLRRAYERLQQASAGDGYTLLAQGESGSREHLAALFARDIHSVLLGTHSFWEGVDVKGEALSCLVIARLPFAVFTDPIVEARCEKIEAEGLDAFVHYSVPSAVIRFRQGFGRLIRSRSDRGAVILADRRVVAKRYGKVFLESLPTRAEVFSDRAAFLDALEEFFSEEETEEPDRKET
ncbi:MAG: helicase C-terminal domain-containing protein [Planctomycetota bacterium]